MPTPRWFASLLAAACLGSHAAAQPVDLSAVPPRDPGTSLREGWQHGVFMEIFVRAWKDSDGDGIGDLRGLASTLPYLKELGIRGIWLMPVMPSADGDHGYATTDYRAIAPEYGTLADLDALLARAKRLGIGVIVDYVINHSAAQHPLFVDARQGPASRYRDWYVWSDTKPEDWTIWGHDPWYHTRDKPWDFQGPLKDLPRPGPGARDFYFGTFGPHMPDFNLRNADTWSYHVDSLRWWLNRGLAGFRLDATPHLVENNARDWNDQPESRRLTKRLLDDVARHYPRRWIVCEATAEPQDWASPEVCGAAFAFGYVHHYVDAARGKPEAVRAIVGPHPRRGARLATMVSNHDIFAGPRLWDQVGGDERRYRLAAAAYLLQPGTPFVYYGEEVGQAGVPGLAGDRPVRGPMSWTADAATGGFTSGQPFRPVAPNVATHNVRSQMRDPDSLWHFYRQMIALRHAHPSIGRGEWLGGRADGLVAQWQRRHGAERTLVVVNYATSGGEAVLADLPPGARLQPLWPATAPRLRAGADGRASSYLGPQSLRVYRVR